MRNGSCGSAGVSNNCVTLSFHIKETFVLFLNDSRAKIIRAIIKQRFLEKFSNLVSNSASSIPRNFNLTPTCSKISSCILYKKKLERKIDGIVRSCSNYSNDLDRIEARKLIASRNFLVDDKGTTSLIIQKSEIGDAHGIMRKTKKTK